MPPSYVPASFDSEAALNAGLRGLPPWEAAATAEAHPQFASPRVRLLLLEALTELGRWQEARTLGLSLLAEAPPEGTPARGKGGPALKTAKKSAPAPKDKTLRPSAKAKKAASAEEKPRRISKIKKVPVEGPPRAEAPGAKVQEGLSEEGGPENLEEGGSEPARAGNPAEKPANAQKDKTLRPAARAEKTTSPKPKTPKNLKKTPSLTESQRAKVWFYLALACQGLELWEEAEAFFARTDTRPNAFYLYRHGLFRRLRGDLPGARALLAESYARSSGRFAYVAEAYAQSLVDEAEAKRRQNPFHARRLLLAVLSDPRLAETRAGARAEILWYQRALAAGFWPLLGGRPRQE